MESQHYPTSQPHSFRTSTVVMESLEVVTRDFVSELEFIFWKTLVGYWKKFRKLQAIFTSFLPSLMATVVCRGWLRWQFKILSGWRDCTIAKHLLSWKIGNRHLTSIFFTMAKKYKIEKIKWGIKKDMQTYFQNKSGSLPRLKLSHVENGSYPAWFLTLSINLNYYLYDLRSLVK